MRRKKPRHAVLVLHGIGRQRPYETLDAFARGLSDAWKLPPGSLKPCRAAHGDWNEAFLRLPLPGGGTLDLYEFYWAPHAEGKIRWWKTLGWLLATAWTPFRYFHEALWAARGRRPAGVFLQELSRLLWVVLPVLLLAGVLGSLGLGWKACLDGVGWVPRFWEGLPVRDRWVWGGSAAALLGTAFFGGLWVRLRREDAAVRGLPVRSGREEELRSYRRFAVWGMEACLIAAALLIGKMPPLPYGSLTNLFVPAGLAVAVWWSWLWLRKIFADVVGDIALYTDADERSESFRVRSGVLRDARRAALNLLRSPQKYDRVFLAGHSLGSVIAYDLLNRLLGEAAASHTASEGGARRLRASELSRLKGLLTFGSPLDKIHYFFRARVPREQAVRAQILSFLHGFRKAPSGRADGPWRLAPYRFPEPSPDFTWVNVWSPQDPVSGFLDFYRLEEEDQVKLSFPWRRWGRAHADYWKDERLYEIFTRRVLKISMNFPGGGGQGAGAG